MESLEPNDAVNYYRYGIEHRDFLIASSDGTFVYDPTDAKAVAQDKAMRERDGDEVLNPYFN